MRHGNRKEEIILAAARIFKEKGYASSSLREVAAAVGVSKPALYHFFRSKDDLLLEILRRPLDAGNESIRQIVKSDLDPRDKLSRSVSTLLEGFILFPNESFVAVREENIECVATHVRKHIITGRRQLVSLWEQIITEGMEAGIFRRDLHLRVAVLGTLQMLRGLATWYAPGRGLTLEEIGEVYVKMILAAFAVSGESSITPNIDSRAEGHGTS